jgi:hypothetical protein
MKTMISVIVSAVFVLLIIVSAMIQSESKKNMTSERVYICPQTLQDELTGKISSDPVDEDISVFRVHDFESDKESEKKSMLELKQADFDLIILNDHGGHNTCTYDPATRTFICKLKAA